MTDKWQRLADQIAQRRGMLGLTQIEVARRGPLSLDRVQAVEGVRSTKYRAGTIAALERALEWEHGSIKAILEGGEPTPREAPSPLRDAARADEEITVEREPSIHEIAKMLEERIRWFEEDNERRRREDEERIKRLEDEVRRLGGQTG